MKVVVQTPRLKRELGMLPLVPRRDRGGGAFNAIWVRASGASVRVRPAVIERTGGKLTLVPPESSRWSASIEAEVVEEGEVIVPARHFQETIADVVDATVTLEHGESDDMLHISTSLERRVVNAYVAETDRAPATDGRPPTPATPPRRARRPRLGSIPRRRIETWRAVPYALAVFALLPLLAAFVHMAVGVREALFVVALLLACAIPVVDAWQRRRFDLVELGVTIAIAYTLLFPIRAAAVLLGFDSPATSPLATADAVSVQKALIFATLGMVAAGIAYVLPIGTRLARRVGVPNIQRAEEPSAAGGVLIFAVGLAAQGTVVAATRWPHRLPILAGRGSGLVSGLTALLLIGLCLLTRRAALGDRGSVRLLALAVVATITLGFAGATKEIAVLGVLAPLVMWHLTRPGGIGARWFAIAAIAVVFVIFPFVQIWRWTALTHGTSDPRKVVPALPSQAFDHLWTTGAPHTFGPADVIAEPLAVTSHRLYGFDTLTLIVHYTPKTIPYQSGATLENLASGLVPRVLWPGKPNIGIGYWFAVHYWGTPSNVLQVPQAVTHPGELYIDFGVVGIVIGLAILGIWYRFVWEALRPRASGTAAVLYTVVFVTVIVVDRDLPLVYVTLVQRLVVTGIVLASIAAAPRLRARVRRHAA